ncbi:MAG TPA: hypothetical protein PK403_04005, partial [Plasticicumulans sp.]|nr:hypothetical protein [Plasticicumulans sp.]
VEGIHVDVDDLARQAAVTPAAQGVRGTGMQSPACDPGQAGSQQAIKYRLTGKHRRRPEHGGRNGG